MTLLQFILIQANLVVLFGLYKWLAAKNGQYNFNRWYLILGPAVAIALPFIIFERSTETTLSVLLPAVEVLKDAQASNATVIDWSQIAIIVGSALVFLEFLPIPFGNSSVRNAPRMWKNSEERKCTCYPQKMEPHTQFSIVFTCIQRTKISEKLC